MNIVIIEDDPYLREELAATFRRAGSMAHTVTCFQDPLQEVLDAKPDLVVIDIGLPGRSGFELCRDLKKLHAEIPVLILTANDRLETELRALGLGADEFVTKPCPPERLIARTHRLLQTYAFVRRCLQIGDLTLDLQTHLLTCLGRSTILPETEARILALLMTSSPAIVPRSALIQEIWGDPAYVDENILQVNLTRLRKHLRAIGLGEIILTVRGEGLRLDLCSIYGSNNDPLSSSDDQPHLDSPAEEGP